MKVNISAFIAGLLFSIGLVVAQMTQPDKVIAFLDLAGNWDPSLAFVMVGAICCHAVAFRVVTRRASPILAERFHLPSRSDVDRPLIVVAILFGIGWGLAGFCPGPAVTSLASIAAEVGVFVSAMFVGMFLNRFIKPLL